MEKRIKTLRYIWLGLLILFIFIFLSPIIINFVYNLFINGLTSEWLGNNSINIINDKFLNTKDTTLIIILMIEVIISIVLLIKDISKRHTWVTTFFFTFTLGIVTVGTILTLISNSYPHDKDNYLNYLENRYSKEFVIGEQLNNKSEEFKEYYIVYNAYLQENKNIKFYVGYGKFSSPGMPFISSKHYNDTYLSAVKEYLQDKYFQTITIDSYNNIGI